GDKWRTCPLWHHTADLLTALLAASGPPHDPDTAVFTARGQPLTRFGITRSCGGTPPVSTTPAPAAQSARTPSGTPPPSTYLKPASKSTSSVAGWATPT